VGIAEVIISPRESSTKGKNKKLYLPSRKGKKKEKGKILIGKKPEQLRSHQTTSPHEAEQEAGEKSHPERKKSSTLKLNVGSEQKRFIRPGGRGRTLA